MRSVVVVDPSLRPYEVRVSKHILKRLWAPYFLHYLTKIRNIDYDVCYENVLLHEETFSHFDQYFDEFLKWFTTGELQLSTTQPNIDNSCYPLMNDLEEEDKIADDDVFTE